MSKYKSHFYINKKIVCKDTKEEVFGYNDYLQTKHWKQLSNKILERDKCCQRCGCENDLVVHHKSYKNLGHEPMSQLIVYCNRCHLIIHKGMKSLKDEKRDLNRYILSLTREQKKEALQILIEHFG